MFTIILYVLAAGLLMLSFLKDKKKDQEGFEKGLEILWKHSAAAFVYSSYYWDYACNSESWYYIKTCWSTVRLDGNGNCLNIRIDYVNSWICGLSTGFSLLGSGAGFMQIAVFISTL